MIRIITILVFSFFHLSLFAQIEINYWFYDNCADSIMKLEYELVDINGISYEPSKNTKTVIVPKNGVYVLTVSKWRKEYKAILFDIRIFENENQYTDTIEFPRICLSDDGILNPMFSGYTKCDRICNGFETDYHKNGNKRLEGYFENAWPKGKLKYYSKTGELEKEELYKNHGLVKTWYYKSGMLTHIEYILRSDRIKTKYYDKKGKLYRTIIE